MPSQLAKEKILNLSTVRHFVLDECDKMLEKLDMRSDVQDIFKLTPHDKQVMMFSATLATEMRSVCKKFMTNVRMMTGIPLDGRAGWDEVEQIDVYLSSRCRQVP